ncbi:hypothetical protein PL263_11820 [Methylomonas sp. EFPC3]|uniref:porin family protein n=1 Tax=Methylomonas TaxID=416 RepID=UPI001128AD2A|nr:MULTISPECIES: porin family protein [Methylomonas]TPQ25059.1 hypothetical protein C2U68_17020 [Methylomonas koyamae]WFP48795.1 hypothetical protein PL263_11820 [Methylomonas sp. EFPC3]
MSFTKTKLALGVAAATLTMAGAMVAPQAQAADNKAERVADAAARKAEALEAQMQQMAEQMQAMQAELSRVKSSSTKDSTETAKIQELDQWMASVKAAPAASGAKDNLVAVRGGWTRLDQSRKAGANQPGAILSGSDLLSDNGNADGFYFGGAFDFNVNNDLFGLMDDTSFGIELGVEYSEFGTGQNNLTATYPAALGTTGIAVSPGTSTDNRLRINASPKIKFMHGSKLRPWIIPVGLELNILGVPSRAVSVLNSGMQFGGGVEYELFRGIVLGSDVRYHYSTSKIDGTETDGFSAGGSVGFKF